MSISSTGLYGSATIVNSDLFNDVEDLKEQVTTLSTSYLQTTAAEMLGTINSQKSATLPDHCLFPIQSH